MSPHTWTAIFTVELTDKEAAQAFTFDQHGKQVLLTRLGGENPRLLDGVVVGCYECELTYSEALGRPCIPDDTIKTQV
jgi:hypothetical protein